MGRFIIRWAYARWLWRTTRELGIHLIEGIIWPQLQRLAGTEKEEVLKELAFNRAVVREYLQEYGEALELFEAYVSAYGADERAQHEIDFLETRV